MHRGPTLRQHRNNFRKAEVNDRVAWYLHEYGRFPTVDELFAMREYREDINPRYYPREKT
jgi:hypothetical protein